MSDVLTPKQRRACMSRIKCRDTKPEMVVRRMVHALGYRYGLHRKDLPGKPDLVFNRMKKVILVNGCFWHMHWCRYGRVKPRANEKFWSDKRESNRERDRRNRKLLNKMGWGVLIVWECWTKNNKKVKQLEERIAAFLR